MPPPTNPKDSVQMAVATTSHRQRAPKAPEITLVERTSEASSIDEGPPPAPQPAKAKRPAVLPSDPDADYYHVAIGYASFTATTPRIPDTEDGPEEGTIDRMLKVPRDGRFVDLSKYTKMGYSWAKRGNVFARIPQHLNIALVDNWVTETGGKASIILYDHPKTVLRTILRIICLIATAFATAALIFTAYKIGLENYWGCFLLVISLAVGIPLVVACIRHLGSGHPVSWWEEAKAFYSLL